MKITIKFFLLILAPVLWIDASVYAGSSFTTISEITTVISIRNAKEMARIYKQIEEARTMSQHVLSREEIEKMKAHAEAVLREQTEIVNDAGASVYCGSQIVE